LSGVKNKKVLTKDIISKVVNEVEKKAAEIDKKL
jgi:(E)-4-hydroxy-3-methylbut-2-enyl-diphosphate synthase